MMYFVFAVVFFRWIFEAARSRGLLVQLEGCAETLTGRLG